MDNSVAICANKCGAHLTGAYVDALAGHMPELALPNADGYLPAMQCPDCERKSAIGDERYPDDVLNAFCGGCTNKLSVNAKLGLRYCSVGDNLGDGLPCSTDGNEPDLLDADRAAGAERDAIELAKVNVEARRERAVVLERRRLVAESEARALAQEQVITPGQNRIDAYADITNIVSATPVADGRRLIGHKPDELLLVEFRGKSRNTGLPTHGYMPLTPDARGYWTYDEGKLKNWLAKAGEDWLRKAIELTAGDGRSSTLTALKNGAKWVRGDIRTKARWSDVLAGLTQAVEEMREDNALPIGLRIIDAELVGAQRDYFPCANGPVNLATKERLDRERAKNLYIPAGDAGPVSYLPDAQSDLVDKLFSHLPDDVAAYLKAALGQAMWRRPQDRFIVLVSDEEHGGEEGKSTLVLGLQSAVGADIYAQGVTRNALRATRGDKGAEGATPEGKALVVGIFGICSEIADWVIGYDRLKSRTGGDLITWRPMYQDERTDVIGATFIMTANKLPMLGLSDTAMRRRAVIIRYPKPQSPDPEIKAAFRKAVSAKGRGHDTRAARAMLRLLIDNASTNHWTSDLAMPDTIREWVAQAASEEQTGFDVWLDGNVALTGLPEDKLGFALVWAQWAQANGIDAKQDSIGGVARGAALAAFKRRFNINVPARNIRVGGWRGKGWTGLRFKTDDERDAVEDAETIVSGADAQPDATGGDARQGAQARETEARLPDAQSINQQATGKQAPDVALTATPEIPELTGDWTDHACVKCRATEGIGLRDANGLRQCVDRDRCEQNQLARKRALRGGR